MKLLCFLLPVFIFAGCVQTPRTEQTSQAEPDPPGIQIDESYTVEEFSAQEMMEWEFHGTGTLERQGSQLMLSESEGSLGVILVSPSSYGKNVLISYDVLTLTPATVLVVMLSSSNNESLGLDIPDNYDGALSTLRDEVGFYMIAFHNAPHNRFPFINKYPKEGGNLLQEAKKAFMLPGVYYHIEVGREGDRICLYIDGQQVLDVVDKNSLEGGKFVFRVRGTGHHEASCLIRNLKVYSK